VAIKVSVRDREEDVGVLAFDEERRRNQADPSADQRLDDQRRGGVVDVGEERLCGAPYLDFVGHPGRCQHRRAGFGSRSATRALLASGVVLLLVLSGCAGTSATNSQPAATDSPYELEAEVTPRPGMLDVEPVRIWYEYADGHEPNTMLVTFASQGPPCEVLDRVEVDETDTRVTLTLYHGRDPEADTDEPCNGPPDRVFAVAVPLTRDFVFEVDVLINGGSLTDRVDIDAMVTPQPGMVDVEPVRWWYDYGSGDEPHVMLVTYASQGPPCEVLDRVEVDETGAGATVTLYQGRHPDADPDEPCQGPTQIVGVQVSLSRNYGPDDAWPYSLAGITAESGEGPVINGGSMSDSP
jgi:hypothetical protein